MKEEDRFYYRQRAEQELALAREARHPNAARAHSLLARYCRDIADNQALRPVREPRPRLRLFAGSR
jgi:hypothetical protein